MCVHVPYEQYEFVALPTNADRLDYIKNTKQDVCDQEARWELEEGPNPDTPTCDMGTSRSGLTYNTRSSVFV